MRAPLNCCNFPQVIIHSGGPTSKGGQRQMGGGGDFFFLSLSFLGYGVWEGGEGVKGCCAYIVIRDVAGRILRACLL